VLAPGLGAQGATPADLASRFAGVRGVVLPTASRSVLAAGPNPAGVRAAAQALRDQLAAAQSPVH
jgi:orotidine-5'-phosphate decarboxylase